MKINLKILLFLLLASNSYCQYIFHIELSDYNLAPNFNQVNGKLVYSGNDINEKAFFSNYEISSFHQSFPASRWQKNLNIFTVVSSSDKLMNEMLIRFPEKYLKGEDITNMKYELSNSYPNDYGTTSPVANLGVPLSMSNYDYINVPKAWDYTFGDPKVKIGISDSYINILDSDFSGKTTLLTSYPYGYNLTSPGGAGPHGTSVAGLAAGQGNNGQGTVGVCSDCSILGVQYGNYNNLLLLAQAGAKVINMSWSFLSTDPNLTTYQGVIDEIYEMGVVLVASAGNQNSYALQYAPNYLVYAYPASYNHVISVTSVNHKNKNIGDEVTNETFGDVSWHVEDMITPTGVMNQNGVYYTPYWDGHTTNEKVDICAPGWKIMIYPWYVLGNIDPITGLPHHYGSGTSQASPQVAGTVGLMLSLNRCLNPDEVKDILQLNSKNIESNPYNSYFLGRIGSGKLETGDAVEFVSEAMDPNGNALIDGQDFYRFNFDLQNINNNLTISNQIFRDKNTSNFVARNSIEVLQNSDFKPNEYGFIDLKVNENIDITCSEMNNVSRSNTQQKKTAVRSNGSKLFPNPNTGSFNISLEDKTIKNISIVVYDVLGKPVYQADNLTDTFEINLPNLASGMYFVRLFSINYSETLKFIKK
ncbi:subtilisin family serine protease [Flavobacterium arsenatis]|uniref:Subtilisin family serine protease n=1 Tax=Flavobacterium arsenatis TaxID=1484332 RepID=A0ABU1TNZ0_9FLAO|nr:S8/S53 family peptidase [Flavobacterium arsenatis]MDR6967670.1 subtilisin family serine protease [Flavobacterium arsenatis]